MMLGSKGILTPMIHGFLRTLCSRNPKNIRNSLIFLRKMAAFSCFAGPKVLFCHASMTNMTF